MIISASNIAMSAQYDYTEIHQKSESLKAWIGNERPDFEGNGRRQIQGGQPRISISNAARDLVRQTLDESDQLVDDAGKGGLSAEDLDKAREQDPKYMLIKAIIEAFTGRKINIRSAEDMSEAATKAEESASKIADATHPGQQQQSAPPQEKAGWGVEYESHEVNYESEQMSFQAQGVIKTADGREIKFSSELSMSREYLATKDVSIRAGDAVKVDPIVVNFAGTAAELTDTKFSFDLNSDGDKEQVSFVGSGSGFLALDRNNDGVVNNGTELFGPASGNGFSELSSLDSDGNNWIDENDAAYNDLKIWTKNSAGADILTSLKDAKIGALHVTGIETPYTFKNSAGIENGEIVSSGLFLNENGTSGTMQQVNLFA